MAKFLDNIVDSLERVLPVFLYSSVGFVLLVAILAILGYLKIKLAIPGYLLAVLLGVLTYMFFKSKLQGKIPTRFEVNTISFLVLNVLLFAVALTLFQLYIPIAVTYSVAGTITTNVALPAINTVISTFVNALLYSLAFYVGLIITAMIL